jgi:hypothetical protein
VQRAQSLAHAPVIVGRQHRDGFRGARASFRRWKGICARIVEPGPGADSMAKVPPAISPRSSGRGDSGPHAAVDLIS